MRNYRPLRMGSVIKKELSDLLMREVELPEGALATISGIEITRDLSQAEVGVSVIPAEKEEETLKILSKNQGRLQRLLNRKLNFRPMPRINFVLDLGLANAAKVEKILLEEES